jgi:formyl transferase-like protein
MSARVVVLTYGAEYGERVLLEMARRGVVPDAALVAEPRRRPLRATPPRALPGALRERLGRALARAGTAIVADPFDESRLPPAERLAGLAAEVRPVGALNSPGMLTALEASRPDWLVLGGVGILGAQALAVPARGTLNVHPALLPWARGVGVIENSLDRRVPVGVSAHFVDAGIDTGDVIRRELVPATPADTVRSLRRKAYERSAELLAELALAARRGDDPVGVAQASAYPYCLYPPPEVLHRIDAAVASGLAVELHEAWRRHFGGHVLPPGEGDHPPVAVEPG